MKELLDLRNRIKKKKPEFIRQDAHKRAEVSFKWRRPKGIHSKMRERRRGHRRCVEIGWGSPRKIKNLDRSGLRIRLVSSVKELEGINPKEEGILIRKSTGLKKRIGLIKKAKEMKIPILNVKDADRFIKEAEKTIAERKERRSMIKKEKEKKEKESKKKKEKEEGIEKVMSDEEKKGEEKKRVDKALTKKA